MQSESVFIIGTIQGICQVFLQFFEYFLLQILFSVDTVENFVLSVNNYLHIGYIFAIIYYE